MEEAALPRLSFKPLNSETARHLQSGGSDANGQTPERQVSDGDGVPCRHCLTQVAEGEPFLVLSHRPFPAAQPYAEQGPIFLHAETCPAHPTSGRLPAMLRGYERLLLRGYGPDDRIVYGTGQVLPTGEIEEVAEALFTDERVAYIHLRSASNTCYLCCIERG
jgi:hypothetical protein